MGYWRVQRDLADMGYEVAAGLFTAAEVGAPHGRERLFILAVADRESANGRVLLRGGRPRQAGAESRRGCEELGDAAAHTRAQEPRDVDHGIQLANQVENWPSATKSTTTGPGTQGREGGVNLQTAAANWPSPQARDHKGALPLEARDRKMDTLDEAAEQRFPSSRPDPETSTPGGESSKATRRLNPRFVEWLMGWPAAWTDFGCSETELSRWRRRMRSALCGLLFGVRTDEPQRHRDTEEPGTTDEH